MGLLDQAAGGGAPAMPTAAPVTPQLAQTAAAAGAPPPGAAPQQAAAPPAGPAAAPGSTPAASGGGGAAQAGVEVPEQEATPEEQQEYERGMQALAKVLYSNEKTSNAVVDQVDPNDLVGSTAKVSMLFLKQLDEKMNLDDAVVAKMTEETVMRIMELAEARHGVAYEERDAQVILSTTWEGITAMFGGAEGDQGGFDELVGTVGADNLPALKETYEAALNG